MDRWSRTCAFPFDKFAHLSVFRVKGAEAECSIPNMKKAIRASPNLRDLCLGVLANDSFPFDNLFIPSLQHLGILDAYCPTFERSSLSRLTSLEIPNNSEIYSSPLWIVLGSCYVQLLSIAVESVNAALLDYLESYSGLQSMRITLGVYSSPEARNMLSRLLSEALPRHRQTLSALAIGTDRHRDYFSSTKHPYSLRAEHLEYILQCPTLTSLSVVVHQSTRTYEPEIAPNDSQGFVKVVSSEIYLRPNVKS